MKIIFYISSMAPAGGIERVLSQHIHFLSGKNELILITDDNNASFYELPLNIKHISLNIDTELTLNESRFKRIFKIIYTFFKNVRLLKKAIKEVEPDCIYTAHPLNLLKVVFSIGNYNKIFVTEHASITGYNSIYKKIAFTFYKKIKLLAVPTTLDSEIYHKKGIKNEYLPNPLSFYPDRTSHHENKIALNIGRFTDDKQHLLLLDLWSKSNALKEGWVLKIIGKGENEDKIRLKIKELGLENNVIVKPPTKDIIEEYINASIFLFTSRAEGFGLVLAEAMACALPCISFNCPSGPRDIINHEKDGYLIEVGDEIGFIDKINFLTSNMEVCKVLGNNARLNIDKFSSKKINERLNYLVDSNF